MERTTTRRGRPSWTHLLLPLAFASAAACAAPIERVASSLDAPSRERPRLRAGAVRLPAFAGEGAPRAPWEVVDAGSLWIDRGRGRWRTPHVVLRTDAGPAESRRAAALAEAHVRRVFGEFGDALDLRAPRDPFPVVVHAGRATFHAALAAATREQPGWGAFYDPRLGTVHVCLEPAPQGTLPFEADLRHEMTHQILDLSTPAAGRWRIFQGHYLWLWEGFAAAAEGGASPVAPTEGGPRWERFEARRGRGGAVPLRLLLALSQDAFEGRHYDQAALLVTFLLADGVPGSRAATLDTLRELLRDRAAPRAFEQRLGMAVDALERVWLDALR